MALTLPQLQNASLILTPETVSLWITLFKKLPEYRAYASVYNEKLAEYFLAANGTVKGRQLNALMKQITQIGSGEVKIQRDAEGTVYDQSDERIEVIREAFGILFDDISAFVLIGGVFDPANGNFGNGVSVGQRPTYCIRCGSSYGYRSRGHTNFQSCGFCG